jgi:hypothetical protein
VALPAGTVTFLFTDVEGSTRRWEGGLTLRDMGEHRLKDLQRPERIFQVAGAGLAQEFPRLKTLGTRQNNLPAQATPFIGRAQVARMALEEHPRPLASQTAEAALVAP